MKRISVIALICLLFDQFSKLVVTINFQINQGYILIPNCFSIMRVHNTGAAWSIMSDSRILLILLSLMALLAIYLCFIKGKQLSKLELVIYGLLMGGILGNLVDRIFRGYVVDFLKFNIFGYNFPVFNIADILIVLSAFSIILLQFGGQKDEHKN